MITESLFGVVFAVIFFLFCFRGFPSTPACLFCAAKVHKKIDMGKLRKMSACCVGKDVLLKEMSWRWAGGAIPALENGFLLLSGCSNPVIPSRRIYPIDCCAISTVLVLITIVEG